MKGNLYSLTEVVNEILIYYKVDLSASDKIRIQENLRKKLSYFCKQIDSNGNKLPEDKNKNKSKGKCPIPENSLWNTSKHGTKKRPDHFFTAQQLHFLKYSSKVREYIQKLDFAYDNEEYERYHEAQKRADKENIANENALSEMSMEPAPDEYSEVGVTDEDVKKKKFEMMIEAIFLKFFTEIDEEKLRHDMEMSYIPSGADVTADTLLARDNLSKRFNYYQEKQQEK